MPTIWKKHSQEEIKTRVFDALAQNVNYEEEHILGVPASYLDDKVFYQDAAIVKDAPFISTLIQNPNHIGCHTLGKSESFFAGTQALEKELIDICAVDILKGEQGEIDGYVAAGGTEANMQAIWIYRNEFLQQGASLDEICIICSADSHYSMAKAANVFVLDIQKVKVDQQLRTISEDTVREAVAEAQARGAKYFIVVNNMMTTMFGSVDDVDCYINVLKETNCEFRIHVDGAYGGFYFPFTEGDNKLTFQNPDITSFTLDAHKMAQAPYGTGLFLIRKGNMHFSNTREASYVEGEDFTLVGSRSGANAVAVWMILVKNGPFGWDEKIFVLQKRTSWLCDQLSALGASFYRHAQSNIVTIASEFVTDEIASHFGLVPDNHNEPNWYKVVIMEHVTIEKLIPLLDEIKKVTTKQTQVIA